MTKKEKETQDQVASAFADLIKTEKKIADLQDDIASATTSLQIRLKAQTDLRDSLKASLQSLIPENASLGGVYHKVSSKPSISYGKYSDFLIQNSIPISKREDAASEKSKFTSFSFLHTFKSAE
jgi:hypothetical protein